MVSFFGFEAPGGCTGKQFIERLSSLHEADIQRRKREIQTLAEITALSIVGGLSKDPLSKSLDLGANQSQRGFMDALWLKDILQTVQSDKEKLTLVDEYLKKTFSDLPLKKLDDLRAWFKNEVEKESKQIRLLRQSFYYRNRSINAIIAFLESKENSDFLARKINHSKEIVDWFSDSRTKFRLHGKGEKFTRNSYISEWDAFINDVWPELPQIDESNDERSLDYKFRAAIQSKVVTVDESLKSPRTKRLLKKYSVGATEFRDNIQKSQKSAQLPSLEMKVRKGVGIFATLLFENADLDYLLSLSSDVLLKSLSEDSLSGISTEIVKGKTPALVVKCECEPNAQILKQFEAFISQLFDLPK